MKAKKSYRETAHAFAQKALKRKPKWSVAKVQCHFFHQVKRRRDGDNLLASMKSAFDGLVDAGVFTDDSGLIHLPVQKSIDKESPRVEITIWNE